MHRLLPILHTSHSRSQVTRRAGADRNGTRLRPSTVLTSPGRALQLRAGLQQPCPGIRVGPRCPAPRGGRQSLPAGQGSTVGPTNDCSPSEPPRRLSDTQPGRKVERFESFKG
eukprot:555359-Hanusia_phi.AAC.2